jgi:hypothetical protein
VSLTRRADRRRLSESGPFCTDSLCHARQVFRVEASMPALKNDKFKDYTRYAEHCLNMMASTQTIRVAFSTKWPPNGSD